MLSMEKNVHSSPITSTNIQSAIQEKVVTEQETEKINLEINKAKKEAQRKKIEAQGIAESQNSKIIIIGGGQDKLPLILSDSAP